MSTPGTSDDSIKIWLKTGDIDKLEEVVINGYGDQLRNKTSRIPKINNFLKQVPHFQSKIDAIHEAVAQGKLREVQSLLDRKKLAMSRIQTGASPLHTAVLNNQTNIAKYILEKFPTAIQARDNQGRTALHYASVLSDEGEMYRILLEHGADKKATDMRGKIPEYYLQNPEEMPLKSLRDGAISKVTRRNDRRNERGRATDAASISVPSKIEVRMLIQKADLHKLEAIVLNGYGDRLLGESSVNSRVKEFLDQVPEFMIKVANLHAAAVEGSLRDVRNLLDRRTLVIARDPYGANVLHRSVVHNHHNIVKYLVNNYPETINTIDFDGRTPLHYSVAVEDERIYKTLIGAGADESIKDNAGKQTDFYKMCALDIHRVVERDKHLASKSNENHSTYYTTLTPNLPSSKSGRSHNGSLTAFNLRQWVRNGEVDKLEQLVLEGHGVRLINQSAIDSRTRTFLKQIPVFLKKIESLHEAVASGNLRRVKVLLDRKQLAKSKHQGGLGLLHKSLTYNHPHITSYICQRYPEALLVKDNEGRIPLHYAAVIKDDGGAYHLLREAGADPLAVDRKGNTAIYYKEHPEELDLLEMQNRINRMRSRMQAIKKSSSNRRHGGGFRVTRANIRKWIHAEDVDKLNQVVFEGHGTKLLVETSSSAKVKEFLKTVPNLIGTIRDVNQAAQEGNLAQLQEIVDNKQLFLSKDIAGISPLHRAVVMGHRDISKYIVQECPDSVKAKDHEGKTALHYAAALPKDDNFIYNMLLEAGGDIQQLDEKGKSPEYYQQHPAEAELRATVIKLNRKLPEIHVSTYTTQRRSKPPSTLRLPKNSNKSLKGIDFNTLSPEHVTKLINKGDVDKLEQLVLEGYGKKLYGKTSWIEDVRNFLKKVPSYMDRIYAVHKATAKGDLRAVEELMDNKKLVIAKDERGLTPLHRAVKYGKTDIVKYMLQMNPAAVHVKDKEGRTPLHLAGMYKDRNVEYKLLENFGADITLIDSKSKTPQEYQQSNMKLEVMTPQSQDDNEDGEQKPNDDLTAEELEDENNINQWIANDDIDSLEQLIVDGKGDLLLGKSSSKEKTKDFLECVPTTMGKIRAIHNTTVEGNLRGLQSLIDKRVYASARDSFGACPLHIALLHGHSDVIRYLGSTFPASLNVQDIDGRTPLHYAAVANDEGMSYRFLHKHGADPNIKDKSGSTPGHYLRGKAGSLAFEDLLKRYEEKKIPPRPPSVQTWQRPPTAEILRALTPDEGDTESTATLTETQTQDEMESQFDASPLTEEMKSEELAIPNEEPRANDESKQDPNLENDEDKNDADKVVEEVPTANTEEPNQEASEKAVVEPPEEPSAEAPQEPSEESPEEVSGEGAEEPSAELPQETSEEAVDEQPEEAVDEQPEEAVDDKPEEAVDERPEEAVDERPEEAVDEKPEEAVDEKPEEAVDEKPEEAVDEKPEEAVDEKPEEAVDEKPEEAVDEKPEEAVDEKPEEAVDENPEEAVDEKPEEAVDEKPEEAVDEQLTEASGEAAEEPPHESIEETTEKLPEENHTAESVETATEELPEENQTAGLTEETTELPEPAAEDPSTDNIENETRLQAAEITKEPVEENVADEALKTNESDNSNAEIKASEDSTEEIVQNEPEETVDANSKQNETATEDQTDETENKEPTTENLEENADDAVQKLTDTEEETANNPQTDTKSTAEETPKTEAEHENPTQTKDNSKSTTPTPNGLRSKHLSRNHSSLSTTDNPMWSKEGEYLASAMGDALIKGLTEVSHRRPKDPISYLAVWLYLHEMRSVEKPSTPYLDKEVDDDDPLMNSIGLEREEMGKGLYEARLARSSGHRASRGSISSPASCVNVIGRIKDESGRTILHFAAGMRHEGNAFWNLLFYTNCSLAEKDVNYLTARDIAENAELVENVNAIDRFVGTLIINNKLDIIKSLMLNCYEHILDVKDPVSGNDIFSTMEKQNESEMFQLLQNIKSFQEKVKNIRQVIVDGDLNKVKEIINEDLAIAKSPFAQCSLHIAVLHEQMQIIEFIASSFPVTLKTKDNMWRTPLHYAMGVENSQSIAKILIQHGASRQSRDVKFRTPSYYFVEPQEIASLISELSFRPSTVIEE